MNRLRKGARLTLAALAVTAVAGSAYAQYTPKGADWPSFQEIDKNADGILDSTETLVLRGFSFKMADKDKDGKVDESEYTTAMKEQGGKGKKGS